MIGQKLPSPPWSKRLESKETSGTPQVRFTERISYRLMRICMLCAVSLGIVLSFSQIALDAISESGRIDDNMRQVLAVLERPAAEAAYNIDEVLAARVLDGIDRYGSILSANISVDPSTELASVANPAKEERWRVITDRVFGASRSYRLELRVDNYDDVAGELLVVLDTAQAGAAFMNRAVVVISSGIIRSIVLALVLLAIFYLVLTKPFFGLVNAFHNVDTKWPERTRLQVPKNHEADEFGQLVRSANDLLESIEDNLYHRKRAETRADYLKRFDRLTNLPNRSELYIRLTNIAETAKGSGDQFALMICDLREFQHINDLYGFQVGDSLLKSYAKRLKSVVPEQQGIVGRLLGDQFGILLEKDADFEQVSALAEKLVATLNEPVVVQGDSIQVGGNVGIALFPKDATTVENLIKNTEKALSIAKTSGRNEYRFYESGLGDEIRARHQIRLGLENADMDQEFQLHYQPQFSVRTGKLVGAEALLRWRHPELGTIKPDLFVPIAEECGVIHQVGEWVFRKACADLARWRQNGERLFRLGINISAVQLQIPNLGDFILATIDEAGLAPDSIELEITETAVMADIDATVVLLEGLRDKGFPIAIDDFGTGHSSLNYLRRLPINTLKIDQSFVREVLHNEGDKQIVAAIINLGHSLNLKIIAEGVENVEQLAVLNELRCDDVQGYYCGMPLTAEHFDEVVAQDVRAGDKRAQLTAQ